ncbi:MAG: isoprenylcysteine carboxylmethyltransferase family protein [Patescibacteria group bacterium]
MLEQILRFSTITTMVAAGIVQLCFLYFYHRDSVQSAITLRINLRGALCASLLLVTGWIVWPENVLIDKSVLWLGCLTIIAGMSLRLWAQFTLKSMWSVGTRILSGHVLTDQGPYRFLRHPMYVGYGLVGIGTILLTQNILILCGWSFFFILLFQRALEESTALYQKFGESFLGWTGGRMMLGPPIWLTLWKINQ